MKRLAIALVGGVAMALIAVGTHPASDRLRADMLRHAPASAPPSVSSR